jgi:hypothetical protein
MDVLSAGTVGYDRVAFGGYANVASGSLTGDSWWDVVFATMDVAAFVGIGKLGTAGRGGPAVKNAGQGPAIIGETMLRVEVAATKYPGAKILNDMPDLKAMGMDADQVTSSMMQYNRKWMLEQMRSGRQIIDIGADANRANPSIFYQMEQNMLRNYQKLHPEFSGAVSP